MSDPALLTGALTVLGACLALGLRWLWRARWDCRFCAFRNGPWRARCWHCGLGYRPERMWR